ncbi:hypothetical protein [Lacrimispora amygdalina]|uniref:hypothetical protein n=1 Tax=Lacrimispora amygdalina TaxID=253257 RepID=UPI000BE2CF96|nr:hypothetical protein [Lacrimispora amygdalina]
MSKFKNPIPSLDDERVSKTYSVVFKFPENVTREEAVIGINNLLEENGGKIPKNWIKMGEPISLRYALSQT